MTKFKPGDKVRVSRNAVFRLGGTVTPSSLAGKSGIVAGVWDNGNYTIETGMIRAVVYPEFVEPFSYPPKTTRSAILADADGLVNGDRQDDYGSPAESLGRIAALWSTYLAWRPDRVAPIEPAEVALLMDLAKTARLSQSLNHRDSWVDKSGYAAIGGEVAAK